MSSSPSSSSSSSPSYSYVPIEPKEVRGADSLQFHIGIFLEQCAWQVLFPVSLPLIYLLRGKNAVTNMRFNFYRPDAPGTQAYTSFFQWHLAIFWLASVGVFLQLDSQWAKEERDGKVLDEVTRAIRLAMQLEVATVSVAAIFQRVAVATKYAFLPQNDYNVLMTIEVPYAKLAEDQLIAGWVDIAPVVMDAELQAAMGRTGLNKDVAFFTLTRKGAKALVDHFRVVKGTQGGEGGQLPANKENNHEDQQDQEMLGIEDEEKEVIGGDDRGRGSATPTTTASLMMKNSSTTGVGKQEISSSQYPPPFPAPPPLYPYPNITTNAVRQEGISQQQQQEPQQLTEKLEAASTTSLNHIPIGDHAAFLNSSFPLPPSTVIAASASSSLSSSSTLEPESSEHHAHDSNSNNNNNNEEHTTPATNTTVRVSSFWLARKMLRSASNGALSIASNISLLLLLASCINAAIPITIRALAGVPALGLDSSQAFVFLSTCYLQLWYPLILLNYVRVGLVDYRRRSIVLQKLTELASRSYEEVKDVGEEGKETRKFASEQKRNNSNSSSSSSGHIQHNHLHHNQNTQIGTLKQNTAVYRHKTEIFSSSSSSLPLVYQLARGESFPQLETTTVIVNAMIKPSNSKKNSNNNNNNNNNNNRQTNDSEEDMNNVLSRTKSGAVLFSPDIFGNDDDDAGDLNLTSSQSTLTQRKGAKTRNNPLHSNLSSQMKNQQSQHSHHHSHHTLRLREPLLPICDGGNAVAWLATRRLLTAFGSRYFHRIQAYTSQALLLTAGITAALLGLIAFGGPALGLGSSNSGSSSTGTSSPIGNNTTTTTTTISSSSIQRAPAVSFAAVAVYDLVLLGVLIVIMLGYGVRANLTGKEHCALIAARQLELIQQEREGERVREIGVRQKNPQHAMTTHLLLQSIIPVLAGHAELEPVTILSLPATPALVNGLMAGFVSVLGVGFDFLRTAVLK